MAGPKKDGKVWRYRVTVKGQRISGTFETKAAALAWEAEQRTRSSKLPFLNSGDKTCADAFDRYAREVSPSKKGERWEILRLAAFGRSSLGRVRIDAVNETHIAAWRDARLQQVTGATVNREMNLISHVFGIAMKEWRWIASRPTTDVRRPADSLPRERRVSPAEIETMCVALGWEHDAVGRRPVTTMQRVAVAFLFALETAMRISEICRLKPADIVGRVAHVHDVKGVKNGTNRNVPLSPRALELWAMVPEGFLLSPSSVDALWRKTTKRAAIKNLHFHDTRHEAITRLAQKIQVLDLARMTGHLDIKQLMRYYNATAEEIAGRL